MKDDAVYRGRCRTESDRLFLAYHIVKDGRFLTSGGNKATMGYSIPAAMGAKRGNPDKQVVAVCG